MNNKYIKIQNDHADLDFIMMVTPKGLVQLYAPARSPE